MTPPRRRSRTSGSSRQPTRGYGLTPWSRALVDLVEGRDKTGTPTGVEVETRRINSARRYFRDNHVRGLTIRSGEVKASVDGTQLDPFDVVLTFHTVDSDTVVGLLRGAGALDDLLGLARGEQPVSLGELLLPTESSDVVSACSCPDETVRCIHVLATVYEVAAEIDRSPTTVLTVMGTDLPTLLGAVERLSGSRGPGTEAGEPTPAAPQPDEITSPADYFRIRAAALPIPKPAPMTPLTDLDPAALRHALRSSGVGPGDIAEAIDALGELYDRLTDDRYR